MSVYADTSFLVSLYAPDVNSAAAVALMRRLPLPIMISHFGELEFINATQLRLFRNELPSAKVRAAYAAFRDDVAGGVVSLVPTTEAIYAEARRISLRWSRMLGTRTVDVMHVASALVLRADAFHTFDERQRRLARAVKLTTA